jgi:hypothetical protein
MKLPKMKDKAFLQLAREEDNRSISAGSMRGVFREGKDPAGETPFRTGRAVTLRVTVPDAVYRRVAELAARHQVSVQRVVAAALAEQVSGWTRVEQMADRGSLERFLAALDQFPATEPALKDRP